MKSYIAIDLGASGGRVMLARWNGRTLELEQLHRFANEPVRLHGTLYWDILRLVHEIKTGLAVAAHSGSEIHAIGIDTWGVDFGLLDKQGRLLENPVHYRDARTAAAIEELDKLIAPRELYEETGLQRMPFNTLYQLYALQTQRPDTLKQADKLLFLPDLLGYFLTGEMTTERSIARTSQLLNIRSGDYSPRMLDLLGLDRSLFCDIVPSGTPLGVLLPELQEETGLGAVPVISVCGHDTQSAVCALPIEQGRSAEAKNFAKVKNFAEAKNFAEVKFFTFLSSGTWSLFGTELDAPIVNDVSYAMNITNEGGFDKTRFLKNITGLWLIQESRRHWQRHGRDMSYAELERLALEAPAFARFIDPDDPVFVAPGNVPKRIREYCTNTNQTPPESPGETMRCIYESLAMKYRATLEKLQTCTGARYDCLHVIGGGVKDGLLCQMTANACGIPVLAGPVEATVLGNVLAQMIAQGEVSGLQQGRAVMKASAAVKEYTPQDCATWAKGWEKFTQLAG